jgi:hypothetical protein
MLKQTAFTRARNFLAEHARPLEAARARFHFESAPAEDVLDALADYQNPDGGFGNSLEPDLRTPASSALATMHAFEYLRELGGDNLPAALELARPAVAYLLNTFNTQEQVWRIIPFEAAGSPHAPWWVQDSLSETFHAFVLNPTANLLGALYDFRELVPPDFLAALSERILTRLRQNPEVSESEFSAAVRLSESPALPPELRDALLPELLRLLPSAVETNPAKWPEYTLRPLQVASHPTSPFYAPLQADVMENFAYDERIQNEDGSWSPNWSWFGLFPDAWEQARQEWMGVITLEKLLAFKAYDNIG